MSDFLLPVVRLYVVTSRKKYLFLSHLDWSLLLHVHRAFLPHTSARSLLAQSSVHTPFLLKLFTRSFLETRLPASKRGKERQ